MMYTHTHTHLGPGGRGGRKETREAASKLLVHSSLLRAGTTHLYRSKVNCW